MTNHESAKSIADVAAITTTVGAVVELLPAIAAVLSIVWTLIRIFETKTMRGLFARIKAIFGGVKK